MKVYIVLEENYNMLLNECDASYIYGVYDNKQKAIERLLKEIEHQKNNYNAVVDEESDIDKYVENIKNDYFRGGIILFSGYQENWDFYSVIMIKEEKIQ